jgi:hypothetical protein
MGADKMSVFDTVRRILFGKPKVIQVPLDPESIKINHQVKALTYENAELKGKLAKRDKDIALFREQEADVREEETVKADLEQQRDEIRNSQLGDVFSFGLFFKKYFRDTKFRERLGYYSYDRSKKLASFGDIGLAQDGSIILTDSKGNLILKMKYAKDMFQSVGALGNDVPSGKIPLWMDKEGIPVENVMEYDSPEIIPDGNGRLRYAKARKRPVFEMIQDYMNQIGELSSDLAEAELVNVQLQNKIDKQDHQLKIHENMAQTSRAELTEVEERAIGIDKVFREMHRTMLRLQNSNNVGEDEVEKLRTVTEELRNEAERQGIKLSDAKAFELIERVWGTLANQLPDVPPPQQQNPPKEPAKV